MRMTGKETLADLYYNNLDKFIDIEQTNKQVEIIKKELDELTKYKRAFEILKRELDIHCSDGEVWFCKCIGETDITKEEYKLLEELIKYDN
jgi:hypothetical protein